MTEATIKMIRAYVRTVSLVAVAGQTSIVLPMIFIFKVPDEFFQTGLFRLAAGASLFAVVVVIRCAACFAYRIGVSRGYIEPFPDCPKAVRVHARCPYYRLALLHMQFTRKTAVLS